MFSLKNKMAFITGGTAGIGLAVARSFVDAGASVVIAGTRENGESIAREIGARFMHLDVTDAAAFESVLASVEADLGLLNILVLNAGIAHEGVIDELDFAETKRNLDVNCNGVFLGLKYGPRHMSNNASIIITSSVSAFWGAPEASAYSASKAAASSLARCAAIELGPRNIRVNAICPGGIKTDMALPEKIFEVLTPAQRQGTTDDLVGVYNLLASDSGSYINGTEIIVDGGLTAGLTLQNLELIFS